MHPFFQTATVTGAEVPWKSATRTLESAGVSRTLAVRGATAAALDSTGSHTASVS